MALTMPQGASYAQGWATDTLWGNQKFQQSIVVTEKPVVPPMSDFYTGFADMQKAFATAFLVRFAEWTCIEALIPYLNQDERTVGAYLDLSHSAATPMDFKVKAEVELIEIKGKNFVLKSCAVTKEKL